MTHVLSCLRRLHLDQYTSAFERCGIDGRMCELLDDELLEFQLGVNDIEHRRTFMHWILTMQPR